MNWARADSCTPSYGNLVSYVLDHDNYNPKKEILIDALDPQQSVTLEQARQNVRKLVNGLHQHGHEQGDTVCIHAFNSIMYPVFFLGIIAAGGRFTGSNPSYTSTELGHHLAISQAKFIITCKAQLDVVRTAAVVKGVSFDRIIVIDDHAGANTTLHVSMNTLLQNCEKPWRTFTSVSASQSTTAALMSTSGTTGLPKMAARSHLSWIAENEAIEDKCPKPYEVRRLLCVPFFHAFAAPLALVSALRSGHTTYVMSRFNHNHFLNAIERFGITETAMPPPLIVRFLAEDPEQITMLNSIELVWSGGAPLSGSTQQAALAMFSPTARICQVYGMTEGGWMSTFQYPESDCTGSVGRLIGSYEAKVVDSEQGNTLEEGRVGEVLLRGPIAMTGYLDNESATTAAFDSEGWLRTGDIGYIDRSGKLETNNNQDLIKVRGWQVAPAELESTLLLHPLLLDAAVIGIPHPLEATEIPRAFVVLKPGSPRLTRAEILSFLSNYLARYKIMDCQIRFCDGIPKSASGKILKSKLRREVGVASDSGYESFGDDFVVRGG
ncbi:AMP-binding enzyme [Delphinella strobiligena]|nr:AMP-binding enzyme [Delphinella strobiligena]